MLKLENKIALVTGASSGMGRATSVLAAKEGATVIVTDIRDSAGEETVALIKKAGGSASYLHMDVTDEGNIQSVTREIVSRFGRIDFLHNNAGGWNLEMADTIESDTHEKWNGWVSLNLTSVFLVTKHVAEHMRKAKSGSIVSTSSINAYFPYYGQAAYAAAKAGVVGFTKEMCLELGPYNVRINAVCPGEILTPQWWDTFNRSKNPQKAMEKLKQMIALRRFAEPEEVARAVIWLGCEEASYITGTTLVVDGGQTAGLPPDQG